MRWITVAAIAIFGLMTPRAGFSQFVEDDVQVLQTFRGTTAGDTFGWVCESIEDINGDGVRELIIPAISSPGRVIVYSGATGEVLNEVVGQILHGYSVNQAGDVNADGVADYIIGGLPVSVYSGIDHRLLYDLTEITGFASSVAGVGDIDGDGFDDLIVGSERTLNVSEDGEVFVISGKTGTVLWHRVGQKSDNYGSAVGALGDVTGDGVPDVIVGAQNAGPNDGGEAYILSGKDGSLFHTLEPSDPTQASVFGQFFASGAEDVDGDGFTDAFVGDYAALGGAGETYIFSGTTGKLLHRFVGIDGNNGFGPGRGIPDVNGDGRADILIGAYTDGTAAPGAGRAYLYSGRSGALLRTITATITNANFGVDAIAVGDVNLDNQTDYLITAVGLSFAGLAPGEAYLVAGTELPCPADLNNDNQVGFRDLVKLLYFARTNDIRGDLNGDRSVDKLDLKVLLADLGRCTS